MSKPLSIYILILLWVSWCSLHSLLISGFITTRMKSILGEKFAYYRLTYNAFSLLTLLPLIIYQFSLPAETIFVWAGPWKTVKIGLYLASFTFFYGGARAFDMHFVLGIRQVHEMRLGKKAEPMDFKTSGILKYVRHPWYSGAILFIWAFGQISDVSLVTKIILTAYIIIGTFLEEKKLIHEIGQPYLAYRKKVPMLIPWKKS